MKKETPSWSEAWTTIYLSALRNIPEVLKPLNAELNPICRLLALLGAHHTLQISRIRVNLFFGVFVIDWVDVYFITLRQLVMLRRFDRVL